MMSVLSLFQKSKFLYRKILTQYFLSIYFGSIGKGAVVFKQFRLINPDKIFLGNGSLLLGNSRIELIKTYQKKNFSPKLIIGNESQIHQNCHITCAENITLGNNVIVVSNVTITDIIHPYHDPYTPINQTNIITKPVFIGDQTYLYNNVVVLPGVNIGMHCVIGANSVVMNDIPDFSVAVGNPAKVIKKYNFETKSWDRV